MAIQGADNPQGQSGFSYVEMLIATSILLASLGPAIDSLRSTSLAAQMHGFETDLHYRVAGRMEDVLAESFDALIDAAGQAGGATIPSSYSDDVATDERVVVYLWFYDIADTNNDSDLFTIADMDADNDSNPLTGVNPFIEMVWVRVEIPGTSHRLESLSYR